MSYKRSGYQMQIANGKYEYKCIIIIFSVKRNEWKIHWNKMVIHFPIFCFVHSPKLTYTTYHTNSNDVQNENDII